MTARQAGVEAMFGRRSRERREDEARPLLAPENPGPDVYALADEPAPVPPPRAPPAREP